MLQLPRPFAMVDSPTRYTFVVARLGMVSSAGVAEARLARAANSAPLEDFMTDSSIQRG